MPPAIPIEMVEYAIDFLYDDIDALGACALASRLLLRTARFHLWYDITVPVQADPTHPRMHDLIEILDSNADIAPLVRILDLKGVMTKSTLSRGRECWDDAAGTMRLWERLPNLQVLVFRFLRFDKGLHQLLLLAYSLPRLEEIVVVDSQAILPAEYSNRPSYRDSVVALEDPPRPRKLRGLSIARGLISWSFLEDLAKLLLEPGMHAQLHRLNLSCVINSGNFVTSDRTDTLPSQAWAPVIASLGPTLRYCTLGLLRAECSPANLANLYASLKQCTCLRMLGIQCSLAALPDDVNYTDRSPFIFLDMLADLLISPSGLGSPLPFPNLDTLEVAWFLASTPIPDGCADACQKLSRALEGRSRHSSSLLSRLNVIMRTQQWADVISATEREELAAQEAVLRSCFDRAVAVGVQLRVDVSGY